MKHWTSMWKSTRASTWTSTSRGNLAKSIKPGSGNGTSNGTFHLREVLVAGRTFAGLSLGSMIFFVLLGIGGIVHQPADAPASSMRGFAADVSGSLFADMLRVEMPLFQRPSSDSGYTGKEAASFLMRVATGINPADPASLLAGEMPGLKIDEAFLLRGSTATGNGPGPKDLPPLPQYGLTASAPDKASGEASGQGQSNAEGASKQKEQAPQAPADAADLKPGAANKAVFIYHSHPRESFHPEVGDDPNSIDKNITLVGKRLAEELETRGIGAVHSGTDYPTEINNYRWELSYKYSMHTVQEAMAREQGLQFIFDLHRDSQRRELTTATIEGKDYAQVFFVIGHRNPEWKKNEAFANRLHEALEARYPGISRGIWGKTAASGNAEYNQSLHNKSVLVEIGGVDNTLEECYRTAGALAEVIEALYWEDAEQVDGKPLVQAEKGAGAG